MQEHSTIVVGGWYFGFQMTGMIGGFFRFEIFDSRITVFG